MLRLGIPIIKFHSCLYFTHSHIRLSSPIVYSIDLQREEIMTDWPVVVFEDIPSQRSLYGPWALTFED